MEINNLIEVKSRAVKGIAIMTSRSFLLQALTFISFLFITVFLDESEIGLFFIVSAVIGFLRYFSDVGLAASLIQKKEEPTETDLKTTFTVQMSLVAIIILVLYLATPFLQSFYKLSDQGVWLLWALAFSFLLASLKTIPSILLERELKFEKLIIPDLLENFAYHFVTVILAWQGFGIVSYIWAVVIRGFIGLITTYIIRPWIPGFAFSRDSLRGLLKFGVPYQLNTFLATIKDDGMIAVLGGIIGASGVGFLGWAQKWSQYPLRLIMDNVMKVTFPAFSRMQNDKKELEKAITKSMFFVCTLIFPAVVGLVVMAPFIIELIPSYQKWTPALIPLFLVSINTIFATITTPLTNILNAIGKIKITFYLMIMWVVLTWAVVPLLSLSYGVNGAALGYAIVGSSSLVAIFVTRKYVSFKLINSVVKPFFSSIVMGYIVFVASKVLPVHIFSAIFIITIGVLSYLLCMYLIIGKSLFEDAKKLAVHLKLKQ